MKIQIVKLGDTSVHIELVPENQKELDVLVKTKPTIQNGYNDGTGKVKFNFDTYIGDHDHAYKKMRRVLVLDCYGEYVPCLTDEELGINEDGTEKADEPEGIKKDST